MLKGLLEHMQPCPNALLTSRRRARATWGVFGYLPCNQIWRETCRPHAEREAVKAPGMEGESRITLQQQTPSWSACSRLGQCYYGETLRGPLQRGRRAPTRQDTVKQRAGARPTANGSGRPRGVRAHRNQQEWADSAEAAALEHRAPRTST